MSSDTPQVSSVYLHVVSDVRAISTYGWASHVLNYLCEFVRLFKKHSDEFVHNRQQTRQKKRKIPSDEVANDNRTLYGDLAIGSSNANLVLWFIFVLSP